ncbi:MAG TPA: HepT-like ribonuclease domain-containing protein [Thermoanaerobaculia bacterium]|jgi:uncharacterized protein with HEPN domain|nr:HepT-like ribonuclease domain-containing protein [Thermoanaerobaculia bacterium]
MIEAAEAATRFAAGRDRADLDSDEMLRFAIVRAVEVIGEAAARVTAPAQEETPSIPWREIVSMRNRLVHAYYDINVDVLWQTVSEDIPAIIPTLRAALQNA